MLFVPISSCSSTTTPLLLVLLLLLTALPTIVFGFSCNTPQTAGEHVLTDSVVTMTSGCTFTSTELLKYVKLDVAQMVQHAIDNGRDAVVITIGSSSFTNIGIQLVGYANESTTPVTTRPILLTMENSTILSEKSRAVHFIGVLPPESMITFRGNTFTMKEYHSVYTESWTLKDNTRVLFDKNTITVTAIALPWYGKPTVASVLTTTEATVMETSSLVWTDNTLISYGTDCGWQCDGAIWYQPQESTVTMNKSSVSWERNVLNTTIYRLARVWYQDESSLTTTNGSKIFWGSNIMIAAAADSGGFPYIWHSYTVVVTEQSSIHFEQNNIMVTADNFARVWYQRAILTVDGDGSVISWGNNQIASICKVPRPYYGDNSIWFQGSPGTEEFTNTTITNKGLVSWSHNNISIENSVHRYLWRHHATEPSTTLLGEEGTILWEWNNVTSTGTEKDWWLWMQTDKVTYVVRQRGAVRWRRNTMHIVNKADNGINCYVSNLKPEKFTIESNGVLAFERNEFNIDATSNKKNKKLFLLKAPIQLNDASVIMDRNAISIVDGITLVRMYDAATQAAPVVGDAKVYMCHNTLNTVEITDYTSRLVMPPQLKPYMRYVCPNTRTLSLTPTHPHTITTSRNNTATRSIAATATATMKPPRTRTLTIPTTTTTTTTNATNNSVADRELAAGKNDDSDSVCYLCIILPIVIILLLICCILLILFICCRRRRQQHKQLDDVVALDNIYPPATNDEANRNAPPEWQDVVVQK